ncbi:MAG: pseudouridine synthase [Woeseiaceae bacterium]|jgi:23S rRNA pseudouridine2457 synthase|nr:pseudouridine synthase [Woeseiaceae bacterium]
MPLILLNKPFRVLSQFSDADGRATLGDYVDRPGVYPAGRLDYDSEGLILLTDDGRLQARISQPRSKILKIYRALVEGEPTSEQLSALVRGVNLKDGTARAGFARMIEAPADLWPREPPVRYRKSVPDQWLEIGLTEGRNRQVRRMTAAVGLPTLRLIRFAIGPYTLDGLAPGEWREVSTTDAWRALGRS